MPGTAPAHGGAGSAFLARAHLLIQRFSFFFLSRYPLVEAFILPPRLIAFCLCQVHRRLSNVQRRLASTWAHQQRLVGAASRPAPCNPFYVSACTCVNKSSCRHWRQVSPACVVDPRVAPQNKPAQFLDLRLRNSAQCRVSGA
jgi:hypothetical protein